MAGGLINAPDYTRTCTCSYQNQTSLALVNMPDVEVWTYPAMKKPAGPVRRLGLNLGAPGDRRAEDGTLTQAQVEALLTDDLWLRNAEHANRMAASLAAAVAEVPGVTVQGEPAVNSVFATIPAEAIVPLQEWSFFWEWDLTVSLVRWMTSFATTDEDVARFVAGVRAIVGRHH